MATNITVAAVFFCGSLLPRTLPRRVLPACRSTVRLGGSIPAILSCSDLLSASSATYLAPRLFLSSFIQPQPSFCARILPAFFSHFFSGHFCFRFFCLSSARHVTPVILTPPKTSAPQTRSPRWCPHRLSRQAFFVPFQTSWASLSRSAVPPHLLNTGVFSVSLLRSLGRLPAAA